MLLIVVKQNIQLIFVIVNTFVLQVAFSWCLLYWELMPTQKPQVLLTLDDELLEKIEDFRYSNRIPSRSEAIRRLIESGLDHCKAESKTPKK